MDFDWKSPFLLEMKVADLISRQAKYGTQLNKRNAQWYIHLLTERIVHIDHQLIPLLPKMLNKGSEYKKPFKLNGDFSKFPGEYANRVGLLRSEVGGPFTCIWYTDFDPGKVAKVKEVMLDMGWIPTEWRLKKMPFQVFRYRKKLQKQSYAAFINGCSQEERDFFEPIVNGFIEANFVNKSKNHMKAILRALGFDLKKTPTFDMIKKKLLMSQYWPTSPKLTDDSFESLESEESKALLLLKKRMVWSHRRSMIVGFLENVRPDGKIAGEANPCATPTARMAHRKIVNVPAGRAPFGKECRSLFTGDFNGVSPAKIVKLLTKEMIATGKWRKKKGTNIKQEWSAKKDKWVDAGYAAYLIPKGYDAFVGGDGAGLELRMLTHYLISISKMLLDKAKENNDLAGVDKYERALKSAYEYREVLLNGDIHTHNQHLAGLPTRDAAKTFIYAFLYGAGDANLGNQLGEDASKGAELRAAFLRECPCIPVLIEWVQEHAKANGWVPAIDGRKLMMRIDQNSGEVMTHKALNTMLQAAGSIVMKYSSIFLDNWIKKDNLKAHQVIFYHDEFQFTCPWDEVPILRGYVDSCVRRAGEFLKMECPLSSDSMLGANWYQTH
ncbi:DNA polymerase [Trabzonvirus APT65]|uniref:DNA-directed DNA polymerase n=1 Tax=Aeromonas phage APT65 TaxID=2982914 RepID=A0A9E8GAK0_9CAUD|nr:DNA polymerase [Aeromonas phage APT65]